TGSALFSEFVTAPEDLTQLGVELMVDDQLRQKGDVSLMLYPPDVIVRELRQFLVLEDFDIIMTGTPAGVGMGQKPDPRYLQDGDEIVTSIAGLGSQRQIVVAES
ncbi:MAG: fumarylacetoacetate hydrolase family protein, partial [Candidatus Puniceispirillaceae bacterium]